MAFFAATGVILSACYALWLYRRVVFGDLIKESLKTIQDMDRREKLIFAPLIAAMMLLGVYPALVLDTIGPSVAALIDHTQTALGGLGPDARRQLRDAAMFAENLNVVLPEVVLAVFAMAALMWGAYAGREVGGRCSGRPASLMVLVGLWVGFQPAGTRTAFDGVVRQRRLRPLRQGADPVRRRGDAGAEPRVSRARPG